MRAPLKLALLALAYYLTAKIGLLFAAQAGGMAPIWPAAGVALAALLLSPRRQWLAVLATIFTVNLLSNLSSGNPLAISAGFAFANSLEPALAAWIMTRLCGEGIAFDNLRQVFALFIIIVAVTSLTATLGAAVPAIGFGAPYWQMWAVWWIANGMGMLVVAPLIVAWANERRRPEDLPILILEAAFLALLLILVTWIVFGHGVMAVDFDPHPYLVFPLLAWAALRFGMRGITSALSIFALLALAITATDLGSHPLGGKEMVTQLVAVQSFIFVASLTGLMVAAIFAERRRALETVIHSERRFRALVEHGADGMALLTPTGEVLYEGPNIYKLTGYTTEERQGRNGLGLIHPDDLPVPRAAFQSVVIAPPGSSESAVFRSIRKDGTVWWTEATATNLLDDPAVQAIVVNYRDITDRKQANDALRESQAMLAAAESLAGVGSWRWDMVTQKVTWSDEMFRLFGVDKAGFDGDVNRVVQERIHPDDIPAVEQSNVSVLQEGRPVPLHYRICLPDGSERTVWAEGRLVTGENGRPIALTGFVQDITARLQAERALRDSEEKYRSLVETAQELVWRCDFQGRFIYLNPAWEKTHGYKLEEMLGKGFGEFQPPHIFERDIQEFSRHLAGGSVNEYETIHLAKDGRELALLFNAVPLFDADGQIIGTQGTAIDITERKQQAGQIQAALAEKETLLRELYHRTKNNMQVIIALLEMQSDALADPRLRQAFDDTKNRIQVMALVHQKLYQAQDLSSLDLGEYLADLTYLVRQSYDLSPGQVSFDLQIENIPALLDIAIPCGLVINEILSNALKHAFPDRRRGHIRIQLFHAAGGVIVLEIADDGVGISPHVNLRRCDTLGMQTIFGIAERQLGAQVDVHTQPGVTWTFRFTNDRYQARV